MGIAFQLCSRFLHLRGLDTLSGSNLASDRLNFEGGSLLFARFTDSNTRSIGTNRRTIVPSHGITSPILLLLLTYAIPSNPLFQRTSRACRMHNRPIEFVRFVFYCSYLARTSQNRLPSTTSLPVRFACARWESQLSSWMVSSLLFGSFCVPLFVDASPWISGPSSRR